MKQRDSAGHAVTGATAEAVAHFETAAHQFRCFVGDPVASIEAALAAAPRMVMAHVLKGYLYLLGTEPFAVPVARACSEAAEGLDATDRERGHVQAVKLLSEGRWRAAGRVLEDLSVALRLDALALILVEQLYLFL